MVTQRSLQALITIWHELPLLIGPSWIEVYARMRRKLEEILSCSDSVDRDWLVCDILEMLRPHPAAAARLEEVRTIFGMDPGTRSHGAIHPTPVPDWSELIDGAAHRLAPPEETRFTDVTAPGRLALGKRSVITLRLTLEPESLSVHTEELVVRLDQTLEVHLVTLSRQLGILGKRVKELVLERGVDSEPVVFYVFGQKAGEAPVRIVLRQGGQVVGTVPLTIEIVDDTATLEEPLEVPPASIGIGGPYVPSADIDFQVLLRQTEGHTTFFFVLHSPTGAIDSCYHEFRGNPIVGSPETYQRNLVRSLEGGATARRLRSLGETLFEDLIPKNLSLRLREILGSQARTLQITSEEPWIPWELLKTDTGGTSPEAFWCEQFQVTRWLPGEVGPSTQIQVERLACVEASAAVPENPCRGLAEDLHYLSELARRSTIDDASLGSATLERLGDLLDRVDVDLWHFAAPGMIDGNETGTVIQLVDGHLSPLDLDRGRRRRIADNRPLVILNVSGAGRQTHSLTGLGGWVTVWVERSRCGAFIAPLWTVDGDLAHTFSTELYEALRRGETLGQAVSSARTAVREADDSDPTWLAYSVYGHPNARVVFGASGKKGSAA